MTEKTQFGIRKNWKQYVLFLMISAFTGSMVGLERSIFPEYAEQGFGISSKSAILSFIIAFGIAKAIANFYTGRFANIYGRKKLLVFGWLLALPVPLILIYAPSWGWVVFANILLGFNQGFAWSSTIVMTIDLVGENNRGLATGLNEFAGYFSVGAMAVVSGYIASVYGVSPYPFYLGIAISITALTISFFWIKDTLELVEQEKVKSHKVEMGSVFWEMTFKNKTLSSVTQGGLVNNLNDGMIWGLLPILLASMNYSTEGIGAIVGIYPMMWGIGQIFTGRMGDHYDKKKMLFWGMLVQGLVIVYMPFAQHYVTLIVLAVLLGLGTALVYPTFMTTIADVTTPMQRAESLGTFRMWRDFGYAIGAIISGITADLFGVEAAMVLVGLMTVSSAVVIHYRMPKLLTIIKKQ